MLLQTRLMLVGAGTGNLYFQEVSGRLICLRLLTGFNSTKSKVMGGEVAELLFNHLLLFLCFHSAISRNVRFFGQ